VEQIPVEKDPAYYHFWIGVLNSVDSELKARSFAPMYGFTMINGRFIKTGRIQSADGATYFDLDAGEIGGNIKIKGNSDYATKSELQVLSSEIKGEVGKFNAQLGGTKAQLDAFQQQTQRDVTDLIRKQNIANENIYHLQTAGFITTAQGNALYASAQLANGDTIASYITQSPNAINLISRNINLNGNVTFSNSMGNINARINQTNEALQSKVNSNSLGSLAWKNKVGKAMMDETIISGGYINTSLINTKNLVVEKAAQIGMFHIGDNDRLIAIRDYNRWIYLSPNGHINLQENQYAADIRPGVLSILSGKFSVNYDQIDPRDWHRYIALNVSELPHKNHIANMSGSHNFHRVVWDDVTGLMGWE